MILLMVINSGLILVQRIFAVKPAAEIIVRCESDILACIPCAR